MNEDRDVPSRPWWLHALAGSPHDPWSRYVDDDPAPPEGGGNDGVREPRRPLPPTLGAAAAVDLPR